MRKLVGDGFPPAFDANNGYSLQGAIRVGRALEELGYIWFEEPVQHYHADNFAKSVRLVNRSPGEARRYLSPANPN